VSGAERDVVALHVPPACAGLCISSANPEVEVKPALSAGEAGLGSEPLADLFDDREISGQPRDVVQLVGS